MQHLFFTEFLVGIEKLLIFLYIHDVASNYRNIFFSKKPGIYMYTDYYYCMLVHWHKYINEVYGSCLLYTSDAADE